MAEILLYVTDEVRPDAMYQDGDIVHGWTTAACMLAHAELKCHKSTAPRGGSGHRPDGLHRLYLEAVSTWKLERISRRLLRRTHLPTGAVDELGPVPNARGHRIDVIAYLSKALAEPQSSIFGTPGAEVWYAPPRLRDAATVSAVWDMLEGETALSRLAHQRFPISDTEKREFLSVPSVDWQDSLTVRLHSQELDFDIHQPEYTPDDQRTSTDQPGDQLARMRRVRLPWRDLSLGVNSQDVTNRSRVLDVRDSSAPVPFQALQVKPRKNFWSVRGHLNDTWTGLLDG